jgi:hypothetical protein
MTYCGGPDVPVTDGGPKLDRRTNATRRPARSTAVTVATLMRAPLADATTPIEGILDLTSLLGGLVIGLTGLFAVVSRSPRHT